MGVAREPPATFAAFCEEAAKAGLFVKVHPRLVPNSALIKLVARAVDKNGAPAGPIVNFLVNGVVVTPAPS